MHYAIISVLKNGGHVASSVYSRMRTGPQSEWSFGVLNVPCEAPGARTSRPSVRLQRLGASHLN